MVLKLHSVILKPPTQTIVLRKFLFQNRCILFKSFYVEMHPQYPCIISLFYKKEWEMRKYNVFWYSQHLFFP